ncbi:MAG: hypothetical protein QME64_05140, partial [bacterium]|nr:hypothetical protein [bacterium]
MMNQLRDAIKLPGALIVCFLLVSLTSASYAKKDFEADRVIELREEIQTLNLLTNLYLTPSQMQQLIPKIQHAEAEREQLQRYLTTNETRTIVAMERLRGELIAGKEISPDTEKKIGSVQAPAKEELYRHKERIDAIAREARNILNPNQRVVLIEYIPCLIPAKDIRNPALVGQAANDARLEQTLERIRKIPAPQYTEFREKIADRILEHKKLYLKKAELEQEKVQLMKVFDEARALSDLDYQVKKSELVARMKPPKKLPRGEEFELERVKQ